MAVIDADGPDARAVERGLTPSRYWDRVEATTDVPVDDWFNVAHEACDRWARDPERVAITFRDGSARDVWTYARLRDASVRLAGALRDDGVGTGDRVAGLLGRGPTAFVTALAVWRLGAIYVPLFTGLGVAALSHRIGAARPRAVVLDAEHRAMWARAAAEAGIDCRVWSDGGADAGEGDVESVLGGATDPAVRTARTRLDTPATIMFTSGTTGAPKGCVMPHSVVLLNRPFVEHCYALERDDVMFAGADPGWSFGLYTVGFSVLATGRRLVTTRGGLDPDRWLRVMAEEGVTFVGAAPSALRRLVRAADAGEGLAPGIRGAVAAGEPLDAPLVEAWRRLGGGDVRDGYGQTEAAMLLANLADSGEPVPGALADVVPGFDVALLPLAGGEVPLVGPATGVIAVRSPRHQGTLTYWERPEAWAARWRGDWFVTDDVARRDADGRFWFVGRDDDLIVTSGYNVGPTEVESVLLAHPAVREAAVVAAPDPARGSVVRAVLVVDPDVDREELTAGLRAAVRERVGRHAYPRVVDVVDALPRTESGKVRRAELRRTASPPTPIPKETR